MRYNWTQLKLVLEAIYLPYLVTMKEVLVWVFL